MDLEIIILSEVGRAEKGKYRVITYMWNLKYDLSMKQKQTHTDARHTLFYQTSQHTHTPLYADLDCVVEASFQNGTHPHHSQPALTPLPQGHSASAE